MTHRTSAARSATVPLRPKLNDPSGRRPATWRPSRALRGFLRGARNPERRSGITRDKAARRDSVRRRAAMRVLTATANLSTTVNPGPPIVHPARIPPETAVSSPDPRSRVPRYETPMRIASHTPVTQTLAFPPAPHYLRADPPRDSPAC